MSNRCPIDPTNAIINLKMKNENVNTLINNIKNGILESCPVIPDMTGGKKRKSKSRSTSRSSSKKK